MVEQNVPIPAASLEDMATAAKNNTDNLRERDLNATARRVEGIVREIEELTEGKDGEFVSVSAHKLSCISAEAPRNESTHVHVGRIFLEQYGIWG
jgi:hypothetical protein